MDGADTEVLLARLRDGVDIIIVQCMREICPVERPSWFRPVRMIMTLQAPLALRVPLRHCNYSCDDEHICFSFHISNFIHRLCVS